VAIEGTVACLVHPEQRVSWLNKSCRCKRTQHSSLWMEQGHSCCGYGLQNWKCGLNSAKA